MTYVGRVTDRQLHALYRSALALIFPSVHEGFGLPILEAIAAGTPVIALPISSVPEVGGDAILYADGTSPLDLVRAMERLAADQSLRDELRKRGRLRAAQFQWERTAHLTVSAYRSAVFQPSEHHCGPGAYCMTCFRAGRRAASRRTRSRSLESAMPGKV